MQYAFSGLVKTSKVSCKPLNYKYRIIIFDEERNDRGLLALALRSSDSGFEILEASSALEIAQHVSAGPVDALVADPGRSFVEVALLASQIRRRSPHSLFWLFTADALPSVLECVGCGVDGRTNKTSAGFLTMPIALGERLRAARELHGRFPLGPGTMLTGVFSVPACLLSNDGRIAAVNREFEELFKRARYELVEGLFDQLLVEPGGQEECRRRVSGVRERWEFSGTVSVNGEERPLVVLTATPIDGQTSAQALWAVQLFDITRWISVGPSPQPTGGESELDNLLFAVSHDLQAPLNSLASHAKTLAVTDAPDGLEARLAAREIGALTARMQLMLDGMLQIASVRADQREPELVNLDGALQDAMENLRSEIEQTSATIERHTLPALIVNRQQMVQVFQNLLANALKFRGNKIPRVRISAEKNGDAVRILVEDNGIGIEPRDVGRIFGMFQRLHNEREYPGIGVGLAICRQIVRANGGEILVESTPGRGSCFIIEFKGAALRTTGIRSARGGVQN